MRENKKSTYYKDEISKCCYLSYKIKKKKKLIKTFC
jgi:hypothetical protein